MLCFCIPTNWTDTLLDNIADLPVTEVYGSLPETPSGGGRAAKVLPRVDAGQAARHIRMCRDRGLAFNYLLNGTCFGNQETDPNFRRAIHRHLQWMSDAGVESITVSNPFMLDFVKSHFPGFLVKTSVFALVGSVAAALQYRALGADAITLLFAKNRDFKALKEIRDAVDCDLWLLANEACSFYCPYIAYHGNTSAHDSQSGRDPNAALNIYPLLKCTVSRLTEADQLLRSRWIRPEDLAVYEKMGYSKFKLSGRDASTDRTIRTVRAYAKRRYDGNLADILEGFHFLGAWRKKAGNIPLTLPYIDNRKLDGFLDYFLNGGCKESCHACHHCEKTAKRAVTLNREANQQLIDVIKAFQEAKLST
jgi:collagenase-like PrtC family protease